MPARRRHRSPARRGQVWAPAAGALATALLLAALPARGTGATPGQQPAASPPAGGATPEALWRAASEGDAGRVAALLRAGADPDAGFRDNQTPLIFAAKRGAAEVVRILLDHGADPSAKEPLNHTSALHYAIGHPEIVRLLVAAGADADQQDLQTHQTPLGWAVLQDCAACAEALLAPPGPAPRSIKTALALARSGRDRQWIERLEAALDDAGELRRWPQFRGERARGDGDGEAPPITWSGPQRHNLLWNAEIPGLGHSSPVVWGRRVFVSTAVASRPVAEPREAGPSSSQQDPVSYSLRLYAFDFDRGEVLWTRSCYEGPPRTGRHPLNSHASSTPVTDGERVIAFFGAHGLCAFDLEGRLLWRRTLPGLDWGFAFDPDYAWAEGTSPVLAGGRLVLQLDTQAGARLVALDAASGETVWSTPRDELPSWSTPTLYPGPLGDELVTNGVRAARGYDPATGELLWTLPTDNSAIAAPTPVFWDDLIVLTNGYRPLKPIYALRGGSRGTLADPDAASAAGSAAAEGLVWSRKSGGPFYITPIAYRALLYVLDENGVLTAYYTRSGERVYRHRVAASGARFSASPVAADGRLYLTAENGDVYVVRAGLEYEELARNPTGERVLATPALVDGRVIVRGRHHLWAFGEEEETP